MNSTTHNLLKRKGKQGKRCEKGSLKLLSFKSRHVKKAKNVGSRVRKKKPLMQKANKYEFLKTSTPNHENYVKANILRKISKYSSSQKAKGNLDLQSKLEAVVVYDRKPKFINESRAVDESDQDLSEPEVFLGFPEDEASESEEDTNRCLPLPLQKVTFFGEDSDDEGTKPFTFNSKENDDGSDLTMEDINSDSRNWSVFPVPSKNIAVCVFEQGVALAMQGITSIQVISGTLSVFGVELTRTSLCLTVYSLPKLQCISIEAKTSENVWKSPIRSDELKSQLVAVATMNIANKVLQKCENSSIIFTIERYKPTLKLSFVELYEPIVFDWRLGNFEHNCELNDYNIALRQSYEGTIDLSVYEPLSLQVLKVVQSAKVFTTDASKTLVYGPQNSGKSTILRYLINKSLQKYEKVFYLDTDPGQTEFTLPGCVSLNEVSEPLVGPPFTHIKEPVKCIFIGNSSIDRSPEMYKKSVYKLIEFYLSNYSDCPLYVNTMGWIDGLGAIYLKKIINRIKPNVLVELVKNEHGPDFTCKKRTQYDWKMVECTVTVPVSNDREYTSALKRDLAIYSYFGDCLKLYNPLKNLNSIEPYSISWKNIALYVFEKFVPPEKLPYALNASIVALCHVDESKILESEVYLYPKTVEPDPDNECIGFGIVRAIDVSKKLFYIVTPVSPEKLKTVNVLMKGNILLPQKFLLNQNIQSTTLPFTSKVVGQVSICNKRVKKRQFVSK